jgi:hypothetical protein
LVDFSAIEEKRNDELEKTHEINLEKHVISEKQGRENVFVFDAYISKGHGSYLERVSSGNICNYFINKICNNSLG